MFEFIQKQYPENFVLKNLKQATFSHILLFLRVGKQTFHIISGAHNAKSKCCYDAKPSAYYFQVKTKISVDFQICISVPLKNGSCQKQSKIASSQMLQWSQILLELFNNCHGSFMRQLEIRSKWSQMYYSNAPEKMSNN